MTRPSSPPPEDHDASPVEKRPDFLRWDWRIQRAGWILLLALIVLALLGAFGDGPLSTTSIAHRALEVSYDRMARRDAPTTIRVTLPPRTDTLATVWLTATLARATRLDQVSPTPMLARAGPGRTTYTFASTRNAATVITFTLYPPHTGAHHGAIGTPDDSAALTLWVLP